MCRLSRRTAFSAAIRACSTGRGGAATAGVAALVGRVARAASAAVRSADRPAGAALRPAPTTGLVVPRRLDAAAFRACGPVRPGDVTVSEAAEALFLALGWAAAGAPRGRAPLPESRGDAAEEVPERDVRRGLACPVGVDIQITP
jgi:hypothetical protein